MFRPSTFNYSPEYSELIGLELDGTVRVAQNLINGLNFSLIDF